MKKNNKLNSDPIGAYRSIGTGMIKAPNKPNEAPRVTKTVTNGDLRAPGGRR